MTHAAVYARYSSNNQRDASIEDQVRQCRARIDREDWTLTQVYSDAAISGGPAQRLCNAHDPDLRIHRYPRFLGTIPETGHIVCHIIRKGLIPLNPV